MSTPSPANAPLIHPFKCVPYPRVKMRVPPHTNRETQSVPVDLRIPRGGRSQPCAHGGVRWSFEIHKPTAGHISLSRNTVTNLPTSYKPYQTLRPLALPIPVPVSAVATIVVIAITASITTLVTTLVTTVVSVSTSPVVIVAATSSLATPVSPIATTSVSATTPVAIPVTAVRPRSPSKDKQRNQANQWKRAGLRSACTFKGCGDCFDRECVTADGKSDAKAGVVYGQRNAEVAG